MRKGFAGTLLVVAAFTAAGQDGTFNITAQAGAGDNVRAGAVTPIQITLQNEREDYQGRVTAAFRMNGEFEARVTRPLDLARGSAKRVTLFLPAPAQANNVWVSYDVSGPLGWRTVASVEQRVVQVDPDIPSFGVIGSAMPRGLPDDMSDDGQVAVYTRFFLPPEQVPDRHQGLEMYDVLFLSPAPRVPLNAGQAQALSEWVTRGGLLIADASERTEAYRIGRLADLLPFVPQATEQGTLPIFDREFAYGVGTVRAGDVIVQSDGHPLVVQQPYGLGAIVAFAFALDDPAFLNWPGHDVLWAGLLGGLLDSPPESQQAMRNTNLTIFSGISQSGTVAGNLAELVTEAPSTGMRLGLVLLLTALYALAAGPGDYWLVRRLGRPKLTWITFPIIVAVFTLIAAVGARYWIGGDWEMRHLGRTMIFPDIDRAVKFDLTGIFVPHADEYRIADSRGAYVRHLGDLYGLDDEMTLEDDTQTIAQRIPIWTHRAYVTSETVTEYPDIQVRILSPDEFEVSNASGETIRPLYRFRGESLRWFTKDTTIASGDTAIIDFPRDGSGMNAQSNRLFVDAAMNPVGKSPFSRELNAREALRRGAVIIAFSAPGKGSSLRVDGQTSASTGKDRIIEVVLYPKTSEEQEEVIFTASAVQL